MRTKIVIKNQASEKPRQVRTERATVRLLGRQMKQWSDSKFDPSTGMFQRKYIEGNPVGRLNAVTIKKLAEKLRKYHSMHFKRFGRIAIRGQPRRLGDFRDAAIYYSKLLESRLEAAPFSIARKNKIKELLQFIAKRIAAESSFQGNEFSLIHRDLHPFNIVKSRNRIELIDWGSSATWDPALDIALMFAKNRLRARQTNFFMKEYMQKSIDQSLRTRVRIYLPMAYLSLGLFPENGPSERHIHQALLLGREI